MGSTPVFAFFDPDASLGEKPFPRQSGCFVP
jgi:hypothetical protein